jgi:hypothetical protein
VVNESAADFLQPIACVLPEFSRFCTIIFVVFFFLFRSLSNDFRQPSLCSASQLKNVNNGTLCTIRASWFKSDGHCQLNIRSRHFEKVHGAMPGKVHDLSHVGTSVEAPMVNGSRRQYHRVACFLDDEQDRDAKGNKEQRIKHQNLMLGCQRTRVSPTNSPNHFPE